MSGSQPQSSSSLEEPEDPNDVTHWLDRWRSLVGKGKHRKAIDAASKAVDILLRTRPNPSEGGFIEVQSQMFSDLGDHYFSQGNYSGSLDVYGYGVKVFELVKTQDGRTLTNLLKAKCKKAHDALAKEFDDEPKSVKKASPKAKKGKNSSSSQEKAPSHPSQIPSPQGIVPSQPKGKKRKGKGKNEKDSSSSQAQAIPTNTNPQEGQSRQQDEESENIVEGVSLEKDLDKPPPKSAHSVQEIAPTAFDSAHSPQKGQSKQQDEESENIVEGVSLEKDLDKPPTRSAHSVQEIAPTPFDSAHSPQEIPPSIHSNQEISPVDSAHSIQGIPPSIDSQDQESDFKPIKFTMESHFSIHECVGISVYRGSVSFLSHNMNCSFIDVGHTVVGVEELKRVRQLGAKETCILHFDNFVQQESTYFLVVDEVVSVEYFFKLKFKHFSASSSESSWWNYIQNDFKVIFRDVVYGLMYLYNYNLYCGSLQSRMFVTPENRGRILPSFNPIRKGKKGIKDDIHQFINAMKSVLRLNGENELCSNFPLELRRLLNFLNPNQASCALWAVNHPFFWGTRERYNFIHELETLKRARQIQFQHFEKKFRKIFQAKWRLLINHLAFQKVYEKGGSSMLEEGDHEMVKGYNTQSDIIRYLVACFKHINGDAYKMFREPNKWYSIEEIDSFLKGFFPSVYCDIFESLSMCDSGGDVKFDRVLKHLTKCTYIKDMEDPGIGVPDQHS